jgi:hypothetical protein
MFVASVHREISVAVEGNYGIFQAGAQLYTRASGNACVLDHVVQTADIE